MPQHSSAKQQTPKRKLPSLLPLFLEEHISGMVSTMYLLISGCSGIQTPSFRTAFPDPPHTP